MHHELERQVDRLRKCETWDRLVAAPAPSTGSFSWRPSTGEIRWSDELCRIFELDPPLTVERVRTRVHPEDVGIFDSTFDLACRTGNDFEGQHRFLMPDNSIKHLRVVAHATRDQDGQLEYIAAVRDVTARRQSEEALDKARSELARVSRLSIMGELAASIAHDVNQPLTGIINNANACLRLLDNGNLDPGVLQGALENIVADATRASAVLARIRAFMKNSPATRSELDINEVIREVLPLASRELHENQVQLQYKLTKGLPPVLVDRVQLQQVLLNLIINGIEAMFTVTDRMRLLWVQSTADELGDVLVAVRDSGTGLGLEADRFFTPFFTTKATGMGMGLTISRSLIEAHGGRLWASPNFPHGATFSFTLPVATRGRS